MTSDTAVKDGGIKLDAAKLLLLGGAANAGSPQPSMIGKKWAESCRGSEAADNMDRCNRRMVGGKMINLRPLSAG